MSSMSSNRVQLRRTAKEVKRHSVMFKATSILCISLIVLVALAYVVSYLYDQLGSFTVGVNKYDMVNQGLSLSETPEFETPISRLSANAISDMTNISKDSLPENVNTVNGAHNGNNYIAYTFYLKNTGEETVTYEYGVYLANVSKGVDEAIRVEVFHDDEPATYAKTKSDGSGPEFETTEFLTSSIVMKEKQRDFKSGDVSKFTVVIWLEGDDPDCVDSIIGGKAKLEMKIGIVEGS